MLTVTYIHIYIPWQQHLINNIIVFWTSCTSEQTEILGSFTSFQPRFTVTAYLEYGVPRSVLYARGGSHSVRISWQVILSFCGIIHCSIYLHIRLLLPSTPHERFIRCLMIYIRKSRTIVSIGLLSRLLWIYKIFLCVFVTDKLLGWKILIRPSVLNSVDILGLSNRQLATRVWAAR